MANNQQQSRNNQWGNKFRSMGKNFQSSMKQTMNGFTGIDKTSTHSSNRSFRSSTVSAIDNNTKSSSGARKYQSARRASIDRNMRHSHSSHSHSIDNPITHTHTHTLSHTHTHSHSNHSPKVSLSSVSSATKYKKRRKRSLLIGRESYINDINQTSSPKTNPNHQTQSANNNNNNNNKLPPNFYPPESFVNLLYRITEMESESTKNISRFGLAILDIDNLRGHIQSPLQKQNPNFKKKGSINSPSASTKAKTKKLKKTHKKHRSLPPQQKIENNHNDNDHEDDDEEDDDEDDDDEDDEDDDSMSASPLSTENLVISGNKEDDIEMKYIDDEDLLSTKSMAMIKKAQNNNVMEDSSDEDDDDDDDDDDEYGLAKIKPEPKSAAERTAAINKQRRKSSLLLRQQDLKELHQYEHKKDDNENDKEGNYLAVGATNMDPYLLFWNNSKKGESVVGVVQDIILMSISKEINATHFGFGEFAILASVTSESELRRIVKKVLNKVSSNVATQKLGPVTLCAGISMFSKGKRKGNRNNNNVSISSWINECRQACRLAKCNGRGRIGCYISYEKRRKLAIELMLEIKKPSSDFSGARVLELIRTGADLNFQYKYDTSLMIAIKKKNNIALRYIIQYDYNPNIQDKKGRTGLILALERDCDGVILDLLVSKRDLNPRIKDYSGRNALLIALKKGYKDIAKTLILLGSEPLLGEKSVLNQWFMGSKCGNIETIEMMLNNMSFPIDMIDSDDMTALMHSSQTGHIKLVKYLLERGANVNIQGHNGYTALMFAIENGKIGVFIELMSLSDILIGLNGDDGTTILMCAAKGAMPEVVPLAINNNVEINAIDFDGNTALMIASQYDSSSVATELLRNHCDLDIKNKKDQNALIICSIYGSSQIGGMLTTLGSTIDVQDMYGKTALMYAASNGFVGIVVNLIKYGANIDLIDNKGINAAEYANKNGQFEIVKMIKQGTLQDVTDILQQMEILKQKNKALFKNVQQLTDMNNELSDRINATELAKNQIQKKLHDTMSRIKYKMNASSSSPSASASTQQPHSFNIGGVKDKMRGVFNTMSVSSPTNKNKNKNQKNQKNKHKNKPKGNAPRPPSKDIKL